MDIGICNLVSAGLEIRSINRERPVRLLRGPTVRRHAYQTLNPPGWSLSMCGQLGLAQLPGCHVEPIQ